jgi:feruloyl esterase
VKAIRLCLALLTAPALAQTAPPPAAGAALRPLAALKPVVACDRLVQAQVSAEVGADVRLESATVVTGGGRPYCRVLGVVAPEVRVEVRLPTEGWTQRYLQTGCGGLCGQLRLRVEKGDGCAPVANGEIALASTDMGHKGQGLGDGSFGTDPAKRIDFAHRAHHVTALLAKALIRAYYGQGPKFSYFSGCSDGGREALIAAQRYPEDFDGIAAGAPALNFSRQNSFYHAGQALANTGPDGRALLTARDMPLLHKGALAACDTIDGLEDGQIDDPRRCRFDPAVLACPGVSQAGACLTPPQVEAARRLYAGARTATGKALVAGGPMPGSELSWVGVFVPVNAGDPIPSESMALASMRNLLWEPRPQMRLADLGFDETTLASLEPARRLYNADDPDLSRFAARGGRLILWHGWSDPHISPLNSLDYYAAVGGKMGEAARAQAMRLFLFPAMFHCFGGDGPSNFDVLTPLMAWVEGGAAPDRILAERRQGPPPGMRPPGPPPGGPGPAGPAGPGAFREGPPPGFSPGPALPPRSRPVFAYPLVARWTGKGSIDEAANFVAAAPKP